MTLPYLQKNYFCLYSLKLFIKGYETIKVSLNSEKHLIYFCRDNTTFCILSDIRVKSKVKSMIYDVLFLRLDNIKFYILFQS